MEQFRLTGETNCLYYVSSQCRTWRPAKTIFLFAPENIARSEKALAAFAADAGWLDAAETDENGVVLILPLAPAGWGNVPTSMVKELYKKVWKDTLSPDPRESLRNVWCWETLIFAVGYDAGAVFAGNAAVEQPNAFAQAALVNGTPGRYSGGDAPSDRWLVPDASPAWNTKNREVPVPVWLLGSQDPHQAMEYFGENCQVTPGAFGPDPETTRLLMAEFATRIRWKNSPDGTPARLKPKAQMDTDGEYILDSVTNNGFVYDFYVRLPQGVASAQGLPLVVSLHGHGEPAWMFAQKNGWPELQDETKAFCLVCPDSPEHTWLVERDEGMQEKMLDALSACFGIDRSRVYLTGFSNGSMATCWYGTRHPQLYAALSPWNSPIVSFEEELVQKEWQMPVFAINGDLDHKMDLPRRSYRKLFESFLRINGCALCPAERENPCHWRADERWDSTDRYTRESGFSQGSRLTTWVYRGSDGAPRVCFTSVENMPHGAIGDEARAAWEFLRHFSRPSGGKQVIYTP